MMKQRLLWFLMGAGCASIVWAFVLSGLVEQLRQSFWGFTGH